MSGRPPRRTNPFPAPRPSPGRVSQPSLRRIGTARLLAAIFALLVVCSLLASGVGTAILDGGFGADEPVEEQGGDVDDEFERSLRERISDDPGDVEAIVSLANLLATTGEVAEAVDWYERALEIEPNNVRTRLDFAASLAAAGRRADAEVQYRTVLTMDGNNIDAHFYLGELYRNWQPPRLAEAIAAYQQVVELAPDAYLAERAEEELARLGATPVASPSRLPPSSASPFVEGTP